jgi:hypothetical protein
MIRFIKMLGNNIINIVNDAGSMTAYPFVYITFRITEIYEPANITFQSVNDISWYAIQIIVAPC